MNLIQKDEMYAYVVLESKLPINEIRSIIKNHFDKAITDGEELFADNFEMYLKMITDFKVVKLFIIA